MYKQVGVKQLKPIVELRAKQGIDKDSILIY